MHNEGLRILMLFTGLLFAGITGFVIYFVILYRNKQQKHVQEQEQLQSAFFQEILKARIEMQEQTLAHVSREIHDNITQVLSFVKLNLAMITGADEQQKNTKIIENKELVSQVISDLRDLSKSLSFEHITKLGLIKTIEIEVNRVNKSGILTIDFHVEGNNYALGEQRELVLFRIFQEALNNTLKHSGARILKITLQYIPELFTLTLEDDGVGLEMSSIDNQIGSGIRNIENRAYLIGAIATINSAPGKGFYINVCLNPLEQRLHPDGNHPNRPG
jgi:signal transduction histidine kinase